MSEKILERCPCCGDASDYDTDEEIDGWFAFCMNRSCGCRSGIFPTIPMARNAWNTRASSLAQEPVTTEPVAWRYQRKEWDVLLWRYQTEALVNDDFEAPSDWIIEPLYAIPAPPQPGRDAVIDTQNYLLSLIAQAITIMLHADGDRDHMNHSNLTCEQSMAIVELLRRCNTALAGDPK